MFGLLMFESRWEKFNRLKIEAARLGKTTSGNSGLTTYAYDKVKPDYRHRLAHE